MIIYNTLILFIMKKSFICVIASIALVSIGGLICSTSNNLKMKSLVVENLEALSDPEGGAITMDFCYEKVTIYSDKGSNNNLCASGTTVILGTPSIPMGSIYGCNSISNSTVPLTAKIGYCYKAQ